jgi:hypothetical protein
MSPCTARHDHSFSDASCSSLCMNAFTEQSPGSFIAAVTIFNAEFFFSWSLEPFTTTIVSVFALFVLVLFCQDRPFFPCSISSVRRRQTRCCGACLAVLNWGWIIAACSPTAFMSFCSASCASPLCCDMTLLAPPCFFPFFGRSFRASVAACALRSSSIPAIPLGKTPAAWFVLCGLRSLTIVLASVSPARHWSGSLSCSPILFFLFHSGDSRFELLLLNSCELCPFFFLFSLELFGEPTPCSTLGTLILQFSGGSSCRDFVLAGANCLQRSLAAIDKSISPSGCDGMGGTRGNAMGGTGGNAMGGAGVAS